MPCDHGIIKLVRSVQESVACQQEEAQPQGMRTQDNFPREELVESTHYAGFRQRSGEIVDRVAQGPLETLSLSTPPCEDEHALWSALPGSLEATGVDDRVVSAPATRAGSASAVSRSENLTLRQVGTRTTGAFAPPLDFGAITACTRQSFIPWMSVGLRPSKAPRLIASISIAVPFRGRLS